MRVDQVHTSQVFEFSEDGFHKFMPQTDPNAEHIEYLASANQFRFNYGNQDRLIESWKSAYRLENPTKHSPATTDCVSCHVARQTTQKGDVLGPVDFGDAIFQTEIDMNMELKEEPSFQNTRAFGYFTTKATVSKRTINETAAVLKFLQQHY